MSIDKIEDISEVKHEMITLIEDYLSDTAPCLTSTEGIQVHKTLTAASLAQLWVLVGYVMDKKIFSVLPSNPNDHLAIAYASMYLGIEPDGYAHT